jgi:hypothetical protein
MKPKRVRAARRLAGPRPAGLRRSIVPQLALSLLAFVLLAAAGLAPAGRPGPAAAQFAAHATLTVLGSPVEVQRAATGSREPAVSGMTLAAGDRVFTGPGGAATLTFFDGSETELAPGAEVLIEQLERRADGRTLVAFAQALGTTLSRVARALLPGSRFRVATPSAAAVVRGTEFEISVTPDQTQTFRGISGSFDVIAGGATQRVHGGEVVVVPPPLPSAAPGGGAEAAQAGPVDAEPLPPAPDTGVRHVALGQLPATATARMAAAPQPGVPAPGTASAAGPAPPAPGTAAAQPAVSLSAPTANSTNTPAATGTPVRRPEEEQPATQATSTPTASTAPPVPTVASTAASVATNTPTPAVPAGTPTVAPPLLPAATVLSTVTPAPAAAPTPPPAGTATAATPTPTATPAPAAAPTPAPVPTVPSSEVDAHPDCGEHLGQVSREPGTGTGGAAKTGENATHGCKATAASG